ncbi:MAG: hypothetical protein AB7I37_03215 [Pirellulales bacterium]
MLYLRDRGPTEIGGFGLSSDDDLLRIEDFVLVDQVCSSVSVVFQDAAVADYFDRQVDLGRHPQSFGRIWLHTHPGRSAEPSLTDEETWDRVFSDCDWAVMFILARGGQTYARLRINGGWRGDFRLRAEVDYSGRFPASDLSSWQAEYDKHVEKWVPRPALAAAGPTAAAGSNERARRLDDWELDLWVGPDRQLP